MNLQSAVIRAFLKYQATFENENKCYLYFFDTTDSKKNNSDKCNLQSSVGIQFSLKLLKVNKCFTPLVYVVLKRFSLSLRYARRLNKDHLIILTRYWEYFISFAIISIDRFKGIWIFLIYQSCTPCVKVWEDYVGKDKIHICHMFSIALKNISWNS